MPLEDILTLNVLVPLDIIIYASLILGVSQSKRKTQPRVEDPVLAFELLEKSLEKAFPELPPGFTLREALSRAERLNLNVDWNRIQLALGRYEAFRYGGEALPGKVQEEVLRLAAILPRGARAAYRH